LFPKEEEKIAKASSSPTCESRPHPRLQWLSQVKLHYFSTPALETQSKPKKFAGDECSENMHDTNIANIVDRAKWAGNGIRRGLKVAAHQAKSVGKLNLAECHGVGDADADNDADAAAGSPQPIMSCF